MFIDTTSNLDGNVGCCRSLQTGPKTSKRVTPFYPLCCFVDHNCCCGNEWYTPVPVPVLPPLLCVVQRQQCRRVENGRRQQYSWTIQGNDQPNPCNNSRRNCRNSFHRHVGPVCSVLHVLLLLVPMESKKTVRNVGGRRCGRIRAIVKKQGKKIWAMFLCRWWMGWIAGIYVVEGTVAKCNNCTEIKICCSKYLYQSSPVLSVISLLCKLYLFGWRLAVHFAPAVSYPGTSSVVQADRLTHTCSPFHVHCSPSTSWCVHLG